MITNTLPALRTADGAGNTPSGGSEPDSGSFLEQVAGGVRELTGKPVTASEVRDWLEGHAPESFPGRDEIAGLLKQILPADSGELKALLNHNHTDDANVDVAALIGAMAAVSSGFTAPEGTGGAESASAGLLGQLRSGASQGVRQLLDDLGAGRTAGADGKGDVNDVFHQLIQAAQGANAVSHAGKPAAAKIDVPTLQIQQPVGQPGFGQAMGERLVWMAKNDVQQARVHLNPPGLGPVELSVHLAHDKTSVSMAAHHAVTREALAADAPRLRTMLEESGFAQVNVDVSQRDARGDEAFTGDGRQSGGAFGFGGIEGIDGDREVAAVSVPRPARSLVDHYA